MEKMPFKSGLPLTEAERNTGKKTIDQIITEAKKERRRKDVEKAFSSPRAQTTPDFNRRILGEKNE